MTNLYRITVTHYGPRNQGDGLAGFVYAENDDGVFDALLGYGLDFYPDEIIEDDPTWKEDGKDDPVEARLEEILARRSDFNETWDFTYGRTAHSWELEAENVGQDEPRRSVLVSLGLVIS